MALLRWHSRVDRAFLTGRVARGLPVPLLALALVLSGCGGDEQAGPQAAVVDTVHVRAEDVPRIVAAVGTVEAEHQTAVGAEVQGQVAGILKDEGSEVVAGTPVIQLDPQPYRFTVQLAQADLARARATLENDQRLLERYDRLLAAGAVDPQTVDDLKARVASGQAAVEQTQAALATARWDLSKTTIRAPFAGTVGKRHVELGQFVDVQEEIFDLVDARPVKVRFGIPEINAAEIEVGDAVTFRVRSDTVSARAAEVDYVSPEVDRATRTFEVTAAYANAELEIVPGSFADINVTTSVHEGAAVVPEAALYTEGDQNYIFVVADSTAHRRTVQLGSRVDGMVEIVSGVRPGEAVITAGQNQVRDGGLVRIAEPEPGQLEREPGSSAGFSTTAAREPATDTREN